MINIWRFYEQQTEGYKLPFSESLTNNQARLSDHPIYKKNSTSAVSFLMSSI